MSPALMVAAIEGLIRLAELISKLRKNNAVTAAWSPAERAEIDTKWVALQSSPAWQTDADKGGPQ